MAAALCGSWQIPVPHHDFESVAAVGTTARLTGGVTVCLLPSERCVQHQVSNPGIDATREGFHQYLMKTAADMDAMRRTIRDEHSYLVSSPGQP